MSRAILCAVLTVASCGGCAALPPSDQVLLYVDTDAPVPRAAGSVSPPPLFDRLSVEVIAPGATSACDGCAREFGLDVDALAQGGVSLGILAPSQAGTVVRIRMYPSWALRDGAPLAEATVEKVIALPADISRVTEIHTVLHVDDLAHPVGSLSAPVDADTGPVESSLVGTWGPARRVDCASPPAPDEACVPGGAYWMNWDWRAEVRRVEYRPHLVSLSPFYLSTHETTVGEWRAHGLAGPTPWSGSPIGDAPEDYCTYEVSGASDSLALNCISWSGAQHYCQSMGKNLPTEAQLEYAQGGLTSQSWVWGNEAPTCTGMIYGRAGVGLFDYLLTECNPTRELTRPMAPGVGTRDQLSLGNRVLLDLNGNVSEWALDFYSPSTDDHCWPVGILRDPRCDRSSTPPVLHTARGGSFLGGSDVSFAASRARVSSPGSPIVGFRCARQGP